MKRFIYLGFAVAGALVLLSTLTLNEVRELHHQQVQTNYVLTKILVQQMGSNVPREMK
jgi:hypothetical protein